MEWKVILKSGLMELIHNIRDNVEGYEELTNDDLNAIIEALINDEEFSGEAEGTIYGAIDGYIDNKNHIASALPDTMFVLGSRNDYDYKMPRIFTDYSLAYAMMELEYKNKLKQCIDDDIFVENPNISKFEANVNYDDNYFSWAIYEVEVNN